MSAPDIVVLGSLNMDLVVRVARAPAAGETVAAHDFIANPGGKGANQAVACARGGARVAMVGCVGDDAFGDALRDALAKDDIDVTGVSSVPTSSGVATIVVDDAGENRIAVVGGANDRLDAYVVQRAAPLIRSARLLLLQLEVPLDAVAAAAAIAHASGVRVVLNPAPVRALDDALWRHVDVIVVNEIEAASLADVSVRDRETALDAARALRRRGPAVVIVTLGADGALLVDDRGARHFGAIPAKVVDTTAAGDTFVGATCAEWVHGTPLDEAVAAGVRAGSLAVTRVGAQASIPSRAEALALPPPEVTPLD